MTSNNYVLSSSPNSVPENFYNLPLQPEKKENIIYSLNAFLEELPGAVRQRKLESIEPGSSNDPVSMLFRRAEITEDNWQDYAIIDETRPYTRNLIATDNENYALLLLCWKPNEESHIHNHPCDGCWLKVFRGKVRECRYDCSLNCVSDVTLDEGELAYITDSMGYHKIGNPSVHNNAITLHLYAPPILRCRVWYDSEDPNREETVESLNFSEFGRVIIK